MIPLDEGQFRATQNDRLRTLLAQILCGEGKALHICRTTCLHIVKNQVHNILLRLFRGGDGSQTLMFQLPVENTGANRAVGGHNTHLLDSVFF